MRLAVVLCFVEALRAVVVAFISITVLLTNFQCLRLVLFSGANEADIFGQQLVSKLLPLKGKKME